MFKKIGLCIFVLITFLFSMDEKTVWEKVFDIAVESKNINTDWSKANLIIPDSARKRLDLNKALVINLLSGIKVEIITPESVTPISINEPPEPSSAILNTLDEIANFAYIYVKQKDIYTALLQGIINNYKLTADSEVLKSKLIELLDNRAIYVYVNQRSKFSDLVQSIIDKL